MTQLLQSEELKKHLVEDVEKLREILAQPDTTDGEISGVLVGIHVAVGTLSQRNTSCPAAVSEVLPLMWEVATDSKRSKSVRLNSIGVLASSISMDDSCYQKAVQLDLLQSAIDFLKELGTKDQTAEETIALTINASVLCQSLTQNDGKECTKALEKGILPVLKQNLGHVQGHIVEAAADLICQLSASGEEAKKRVAAEGLVTPLAKIMTSTTDQETLCKVLLALGMLCGNAQATEAQAEFAGVPGALTKIVTLTRTSTDDDIKVVSRDLFKAMGANVALREKMAQALRDSMPTV